MIFRDLSARGGRAHFYAFFYRIRLERGRRCDIISCMTAIKLENVYYAYEADGDKAAVNAVDGVSLEIEEGAFVAVVGHNGSGKSTLARLLNGLLLPDKGSVTVFGTDTRDEKNIYNVRSSVGMVFQNPDNQMVASVVEDDIAFGPENLGLQREEIIRRVDWALEQVGMSEYRKSTPFRMSGGQKQRLAIAGVLAIRPKVLVLDESTAMLDPKGRREVMDVIHALNKREKMSVIHITHYMEEVLEADRVIVMDGGRIALDDAPHAVFARGAELKKFRLAPPAVTLIADALAECGADIPRSVTTEEELEEAICRSLSKD